MFEVTIHDPALVTLARMFALEVVDSRPPNEVITRGDAPYMERWMLDDRPDFRRPVGRREPDGSAA